MVETCFYYLHPLLAGPVDAWAGQLDRIAAMRFDTVVVAPPFAAGRTGDLFLVADFDRLDPRLGGGGAVAGLARLAASCRERGLGLMLDLVIDRVAAEGAGNGLAAWYRVESPDLLPDPRQPPQQPGVAKLAGNGDASALAKWWTQRLTEWVEAGVTGFRCVRPERAPAAIWRELIAAVRRSRPDTRFMAATAAADAVKDCGFDWIECCAGDWDYRAEGFAVAADRLAHIAPLVAVAEAPFQRRLGRGFTDAGRARRAAHRALAFATACGSGWLLPMGFEFGAARALPATGPRILPRWSPTRHST